MDFRIIDFPQLNSYARLEAQSSYTLTPCGILERHQESATKAETSSMTIHEHALYFGMSRLQNTYRAPIGCAAQRGTPYPPMRGRRPQRDDCSLVDKAPAYRHQRQR